MFSPNPVSLVFGWWAQWPVLRQRWKTLVLPATGICTVQIPWRLEQVASVKVCRNSVRNSFVGWTEQHCQHLPFPRKKTRILQEENPPTRSSIKNKKKRKEKKRANVLHVVLVFCSCSPKLRWLGGSFRAGWDFVCAAVIVCIYNI